MQLKRLCDAEYLQQLDSGDNTINTYFINENKTLQSYFNTIYYTDSNRNYYGFLYFFSLKRL